MNLSTIRHRSFLPLLCLLLLSPILEAQNSPNPPQQDKIRNSDSSDTQLRIANAQIATMREYDAKIIGTVYWALSVAVTIVVLMVGFNWYTSHRIYDRDRNNLISGIDKKLETSSQAVTQEIKAIREDVDNRLTKLGLETQSKIETTSKETRAELEKSLTRELVEVKAKVDSLRSKFNFARIELFEHLGDENLSKELYLGALNNYREVLEASIELAWDRASSEALGKLKTAAGKASVITEGIAASLRTILDKTPPKYANERKAILELFSAKISQK